MTALSLKPGPMDRFAAALEDRLKTVFPPTRFTMDWVPASPSQSQWLRLLRKPPFIGLGWTMIDPVHGGAQRQFIGDITFTVLLAVSNEAGPRNRLLGDKMAPGVMTLAQVAAVILHGHTFADLGTAHVTQIAHASLDGFEAENLGMAQIMLKIPLRIGLADVLDGDDLTPDTLSELSIAWSFDGGANPALSDLITTGAT